jgi:hypothetical protein
VVAVERPVLPCTFTCLIFQSFQISQIFEIVAGSFKCGNEHSGSIKCWKFFENPLASQEEIFSMETVSYLKLSARCISLYVISTIQQNAVQHNIYQYSTSSTTCFGVIAPFSGGRRNFCLSFYVPCGL